MKPTDTSERDDFERVDQVLRDFFAKELPPTRVDSIPPVRGDYGDVRRPQYFGVVVAALGLMLVCGGLWSADTTPREYDFGSRNQSAGSLSVTDTEQTPTERPIPVLPFVDPPRHRSTLPVELQGTEVRFDVAVEPEGRITIPELEIVVPDRRDPSDKDFPATDRRPPEGELRPRR